MTLRKGSEVFLVQCKQWRAFKVSVIVVRELYGVMAAKGAAGGFVVTSGVFTRDAHEFAEGKNIELIDGTTLAAMIGKSRAAPRKTPVSVNSVTPAPTAQLATSAATHMAGPSCPRCGSAMMRRIAKQGANVGNAFWGCSEFPKCRGARGAD
uniref:restriction endonuclease n=1 Tax=Trinickia acidisoli TaxID=2767482 RepID=UPI002852EB5B|nr:restriction endonuclease [Trinickia acidisoli]